MNERRRKRRGRGGEKKKENEEEEKEGSPLNSFNIKEEGIHHHKERRVGKDGGELSRMLDAGKQTHWVKDYIKVKTGPLTYSVEYTATKKELNCSGV